MRFGCFVHPTRSCRYIYIYMWNPCFIDAITTKWDLWSKLAWVILPPRQGYHVFWKNTCRTNILHALFEYVHSRQSFFILQNSSNTLLGCICYIPCRQQITIRHVRYGKFPAHTIWRHPEHQASGSPPVIIKSYCIHIVLWHPSNVHIEPIKWLTTGKHKIALHTQICVCHPSNLRSVVTSKLLHRISPRIRSAWSRNLMAIWILKYSWSGTVSIWFWYVVRVKLSNTTSRFLYRVSFPKKKIYIYI